MGKFDEFNKKVNLKELEKQQKEVREGSGSGDYPEVPATPTSTGSRPRTATTRLITIPPSSQASART